MAAAGNGTVMGRMIPHFQQSGESSISLNNTETETFIKLYRQQELLWNVNLTDHTNKTKRTESLQMISHLMGKNWSVQQVKDKIISLRSRYSKEIVKVRVSIASGADPHYHPVWRFFPMLDCFLRPFSTTRKTDTPVVRAFHRRLMGGLSGSQPSSSSSSPSPAVIHSPGDVPPASSVRFLHYPLPSTMSALSRYHASAQHYLPPQHLAYQGGNDDDDVQIVEEEDVSRILEEAAMVIDDDGDDDDDSGYNGGFQEGIFLSENFLENGKDDRSSVGKKGSWDNSPDAGDVGASNSGNSAEDGCLYDDEEEPGHLVNHQSSNHHNSESIHEEEDLYNQQVHSPLPVKEQPQNDGTSFSETETVSGADHPNSLQHPEVEGVRSAKIKIKQEKQTGRLSPPLPPLPVRLFSATTDKAHDNSFGFHSSEDSSALTSECFQAGNEDSNSSYCDQAETQGASSSSVNDSSVSEPLLKRIKQEKGSALGGHSSSHMEKNSSYTIQTVKGTSHRKSPVTSGRVISGNAASHDFPSSLAPTSVWRHRTNTELKNHNSVVPVPSSNELTNQMVSETVDPSSNDECDTADFASHVTDQVTEAVSSQMMNLLQTLVSNLVDKTSGGASTDAEMAFANYVKIEMSKLDEDLQADVKFNIQKAIYDAQKEMSRRRTQNKNSEA